MIVSDQITEQIDCQEEECVFAQGQIEFDSMCLGAEVGFSADLIPFPSEELFWSWTLGNGTISNNETASTNYDSEGPWNVSLTVTMVDDPSCMIQIDSTISLVPEPTVSILGPDTVCTGEMAFYSVPEALDSIVWAPGMTGQDFQTTVWNDTTLFITAFLDGCSSEMSTSTVTQSLPNIDIIAPNTACSGQEVQVELLLPEGEIEWSWGSNSSSLDTILLENAILEFQYYDSYCIEEHEIPIEIYDAPSIEIMGPSETCEGTDPQFTAVGANEYLWSNGSTEPSSSYQILADTLVYVVGANECGTDSASIMVNVVQQNSYPENILLTLPFGGFVSLDILDQLNYTVIVEDQVLCHNCLNESLQFFESGLLEVIFTQDNGCSGTISIALTVEECAGPWIPTAFTPDGDGVNDSFSAVVNPNCISEFSLLIYNRWAEVVFESNDPLDFWIGNSKSDGDNLAQDEVYGYQCTYRLSSSTEVITIQGKVTMLR